MEKMLGYRDDEFDNLFGKWRKRIHPEDLAFVESTLQSYLGGDASHYEIEHRLQHKDGGYRWILTRGACATRPS
jgi:PAS domain S-box-containing protein